MEGQTKVADTGSVPAQSETGAAITPDKLFEASEADYAQARSDHIKKHGDGSWEKYIGGLAAPDAKPSTPAAKPALATVEQPGDGADDAEPGEITIDASGAARDTKTGQFVPKQAFLRVKGSEKAQREQNATLIGQLAAAQERVAILMEAMPQSQATKAQEVEPDAPIDPKEDLLGAVAQISKRIEQLSKQGTETQKATNARIEAQEHQQYTMSDAQRFAAKNPDFQAAFAHAVQAQEAVQVAMGMTPEAAKKAVMAQVNHLIASARKEGASWAERVYKYAGVVGYKKAEPTAGDGETEAAKAARLEIERINKGQEASASLRGTGQGGGGEALTREKVATMSEGDYYSTRSSYIAKHGKAAWEKFMNV